MLAEVAANPSHFVVATEPGLMGTEQVLTQLLEDWKIGTDKAHSLADVPQPDIVLA